MGAQPARLQGVQGHPVGVGRGGELAEGAAGAVALGEEAAGGTFAEAQVEEVVEIGAGGHRDAVADVEQGLAPRQAGEGGDHLLQAVDRALEVLVALAGVEVDQWLGLVEALAGVDVLDDLVALLVGLDGVGGERLEAEQRLAHQVTIAGEGLADVEVALEGHHHGAVAGLEVGGEKGPHLANHPVAAEGPQVEVVEVQDQVEALVLRHGLRTAEHRFGDGASGTGSSVGGAGVDSAGRPPSTA